MSQKDYRLGFPENVTQDVKIVARTMAGSDAAREYRLGLPDNVSQPVEVVSQALAFEGAETEFRLGRPENVTQPVEVAAQGLTETASEQRSSPAPAADLQRVPLDNQEIYQILRAVAQTISGDDLYEGIDVSQPAEHGVRVGLVGFSQARGDLGRLLAIMKRRDPSLFSVIMGRDAEELLRVTGESNPEGRLQPVAGSHLCQPDWQEKFRRVGQQEIYQAAQNETAIEHQFRPMLPAAADLSLRTDRGLALLYDRVLSLGSESGVEWMRQRLPAAGVSGEDDRLRALIAAAGQDSERLQRVYDSPLLNGTAYDF